MSFNIDQIKCFNSCINNEYIVLKAILDYTNDPTLINTIYENGESLLHIAAKNGSNHCLKVILKHENGSKHLNKLSDHGFAPIHFASMSHRRCVKILIKAGADINIKTDTGWTPLHMTTGYSNTFIAQYLLENNANKTIRDINDTSVLDLANYLNSSKSYIEFLKENKVN